MNVHITDHCSAVTKVAGAADEQHPDAKLVNLFQEWKAAERHAQALAEEVCHLFHNARTEHDRSLDSGYTETETRMDNAQDRVDEIVCMILDTPAQTELGIAVKLSIWAHFADHSDRSTVEGEAAVAAYQDALRISGLS